MLCFNTIIIETLEYTHTNSVKQPAIYTIVACYIDQCMGSFFRITGYISSFRRLFLKCNSYFADCIGDNTRCR